MARTTKSGEEFKAGVVKTFLSSSPTAVEFALRFGLSPDEARILISEAISHHEHGLVGQGSAIPITALPPAELMRLSRDELRMLLRHFPDFEATKPS